MKLKKKCLIPAILSALVLFASCKDNKEGNKEDKEGFQDRSAYYTTSLKRPVKCQFKPVGLVASFPDYSEYHYFRQSSISSNYKRHGEQWDCYLNGNWASIEVWFAGRRHGEKIKWNKKGIKILHERWKYGQKVGLQEAWHENGQQWKAESYNNKGEKHGRSRGWDKKGFKFVDFTYVNGKATCPSKDWDRFTKKIRYEKKRSWLGKCVTYSGGVAIPEKKD